MKSQDKKSQQENTQSSDKLKAVQFAIDQIEKQHGKGAIMRLSDSHVVNVGAISTGCMSLDAAIGIYSSRTSNDSLSSVSAYKSRPSSQSPTN